MDVSLDMPVIAELIEILEGKMSTEAATHFENAVGLLEGLRYRGYDICDLDELHQRGLDVGYTYVLASELDEAIGVYPTFLEAWFGACADSNEVQNEAGDEVDDGESFTWTLVFREATPNIFTLESRLPRHRPGEQPLGRYIITRLDR